MPRILITSRSPGINQATAAEFCDRGWKVTATMRRPSGEGLPVSDPLQLMPRDVTRPDSIAAAIDAAGAFDAQVNNAGIGMIYVLERAAIARTRELVETTVRGATATTRAVMPAMRECRHSVIVYVSSSATLRPLPALSVYSASKAALNTFTESFALEAAEFGIRVRLVLPGRAPETAFDRNAVAQMGMDAPEAYVAFAQTCFHAHRATIERTAPRDVARADSRTVWRALWRVVSDESASMKLPEGPGAESWFRAAGLAAA